MTPECLRVKIIPALVSLTRQGLRGGRGAWGLMACYQDMFDLHLSVLKGNSCQDPPGLFGTPFNFRYSCDFSTWKLKRIYVLQNNNLSLSDKSSHRFNPNMPVTELNFITSNVKKLAEVQAILGTTVALTSTAVDLPEIQGTMEQISADKCRRAALVVC